MTMAKRPSGPTVRKDPKTELWEFVFESQHRRPDGRRRQVHRRGFPTRAAAKAALEVALADDARLRDPPEGALTVAAVLDQVTRTKRLANRAPNTVGPVRVGAGAHQGPLRRVA